MIIKGGNDWPKQRAMGGPKWLYFQRRALNALSSYVGSLSDKAAGKARQADLYVSKADR